MWNIFREIKCNCSFVFLRHTLNNQSVHWLFTLSYNMKYLYICVCVCVCVCVRCSSCSFPLLCCVVRSGRPMLSSVMSAALLCVAFEWHPHTQISSPSAVSLTLRSHPSARPQLRTARPIKPWLRPISQAQWLLRCWFRQRTLANRLVWWRSRSMAAHCSRGSPPSCPSGSEDRTKRGSMKSTFSSTMRAQRKESKSGTDLNIIYRYQKMFLQRLQLALHTTTMYVKWNTLDVLTFSFNLKVFTSKSGVGITTHYKWSLLFEGSKVIGQLAAQLFHGQVCVISL